MVISSFLGHSLCLSAVYSHMYCHLYIQTEILLSRWLLTHVKIMVDADFRKCYAWISAFYQVKLN